MMRDEISDDLRYIFGDDWRHETYRYWAVTSETWDNVRDCIPKSSFNDNSEVVYKVWLSKYGGLASYNPVREYRLSVGHHTDAKYRAIALRAYEVIERNLRAAHPDLNLTLRVRVDRKTGEEMPDWIEWEHSQRVWSKKLGRRPW